MLLYHRQLTRAEYHELRRGALPTAMQHLLQSELDTTSSSASYFRAQPWVMSGDLQTMRNGDLDLSYLRVVHCRVHGDAFGAAVSKQCCKKHQTEVCPACLQHLSDTPSHAILRCTDTDMETARGSQVEDIVGQMRVAVPDWANMFDTEPDDLGKTRLLLQAPNFVEGAVKRLAIMKMLSSLLSELVTAHPTYSQYVKGKHVYHLNYYTKYGQGCGDASDSSDSEYGCGECDFTGTEEEVAEHERSCEIPSLQ